MTGDSLPLSGAITILQMIEIGGEKTGPSGLEKRVAYLFGKVLLLADPEAHESALMTSSCSFSCATSSAVFPSALSAVRSAPLQQRGGEAAGQVA